MVHDEESLVNILGCKRGRESDEWADYNFFGHQLVIHVDPNYVGKSHHNEVDGKSVPIPHFGVVIPWDDFDKFANMLNSNSIHFIIANIRIVSNLIFNNQDSMQVDN